MLRNGERWRWRQHGRSVRRVESSVGGAPPATRADVRDAVMYALAAELRALDAGDVEEALDVAVEGYLEEHAARGGAVSD